MVARKAHNLEVRGSNPLPATNKTRHICGGFFYAFRVSDIACLSRIKALKNLKQIFKLMRDKFGQITYVRSLYSLHKLWPHLETVFFLA